MAVDVFLKLGTIAGESTDDKHKGEIDVLSWSWGINQSGTMAPGGGGGAGKASFHDLSFMHSFDKASPAIMKACATGEHIPEATLIVAQGGQGAAGVHHLQADRHPGHERAAIGQFRTPDGERVDAVREGRHGVQAAEGRWLARRRRALHLRHQGQQGRLVRPCPPASETACLPSIQAGSDVGTARAEEERGVGVPRERRGPARRHVPGRQRRPGRPNQGRVGGCGSSQGNPGRRLVLGHESAAGAWRRHHCHRQGLRAGAQDRQGHRHRVHGADVGPAVTTSRSRRPC